MSWTNLLILSLLAFRSSAQNECNLSIRIRLLFSSHDTISFSEYQPCLTVQITNTGDQPVKIPPITFGPESAPGSFPTLVLRAYVQSENKQKAYNKSQDARLQPYKRDSITIEPGQYIVESVPFFPSTGIQHPGSYYVEAILRVGTPGAYKAFVSKQVVVYVTE